MREVNWDRIDRSISSLRTLRPEFDSDIFWFRDDLHQPYPISPLGMTTIQKHHAWGYHVAAEETKLPSSKGSHVKIYHGRVYLGFEYITDENVIKKRAQEHQRLLDELKINWNDYYKRYINEVMEGLAFMASVSDEWPDGDLLYGLQRSEEINQRNWEIHFLLMYPADGLYFQFEDFCKKKGLSETEFTIMLKGMETVATKTEEALYDLAVVLEQKGMGDLLLANSANFLESIKEDSRAKEWLQQFNSFLETFGHRITAAHLDVIFPTWIEDPRPVLETMQGYVLKIREGYDIRTERRRAVEQAQKMAGEFARKLGPSERETFEQLLKVARQVYAFQEDHGFYIDIGSTARLHEVAMVCGRRLTLYGLLEKADDVFFLKFSELEEVFKGLKRNRNAAISHYARLIHGLVKERKEEWNLLRESAEQPPLTLGAVPRQVEDPIQIKVFGMIEEVIKAGRVVEEVVERIEGFAGAPGVAEGPAKVVLSFEDFPKVQPGDILVCPYTATAWTPLFPKIKAVVTDTGGMLTHAAIAAREYGIPAVVGTWKATKSIKDGDTIRVDGSKGVVEIIKRKGQG